MKLSKIVLALLLVSPPIFADNDELLHEQIRLLRQQTKALETKLNHLQQQLDNKGRATNIQQQRSQKAQAVRRPATSKPAAIAHQAKVQQAQNTKQATPFEQHVPSVKSQATHDNQSDNTMQHQAKTGDYHSAELSVHTPEGHPESARFYPTALVADNKVITYIAGTPVVSSPYIGDRPAFDGSDYIVNISSINRDIRLMQQRRRLYRAYKEIGYPIPRMPIVAISGKAEPEAYIKGSYTGPVSGDLTLGSSEIDFAAAGSENVEAYIAISYDESPPTFGPRVDNSSIDLNLGFINIGNLDKTPFYFTAGQFYIPFGRYSSGMVGSPLTLNVGRTKTRPFIFGYKSQEDTGVFAAVYGYNADTTLGKSAVTGSNLGYIYSVGPYNGEIGGSYITSIDDSGGMQINGSTNGNFGGFGSGLYGSEKVAKVPAVDFHGNVAFGRYNFYAEWLAVTHAFRVQDLSMNGLGASPQAGQIEGNVTFRAFNRPSSIALGYQWTKDALALKLPQQRYVGTFNISIWKDTVESIEYKHDVDYPWNQFANGANPTGGLPANINTLGTGLASDTVSLQIGVYF